MLVTKSKTKMSVTIQTVITRYAFIASVRHFSLTYD